MKEEAHNQTQTITHVQMHAKRVWDRRDKTKDTVGEQEEKQEERGRGCSTPIAP